MNAHTMNEEEELGSVEHTHGEVMPRRTRNNDLDEPPAVRARVETVTQPKWTLNSRVREVLVETPKLNDFLRNNVGGRGVVDSNENVTMEAFVIDPAMYIQDEKLRNHITALPAYKKAEVANNLEKAGVCYLWQWDEFTDKKSILLMARGILDGALDIAKEEKHVSLDTTPVFVQGVYESVYNATWHYVEGVVGEGFGMQVKEGHPPQMWTEDEVMKGSAEDDNDNPKDGRLELMVLTSKEGWPYTEFSMEESCDIYVNKEVKRTWHKILKDLDEYFVDNVDANKKLTRRVLMGTPGIGKSFAAGSFLLYQLLRYDSERLPMVAYFTQGWAYLFEKKSDGGKVTWYTENNGLRYIVQDLSKHKRGYIIYDVSEKSPMPPDALPPSGWGMVVISSPNVEQYKGWKKQKGAYRIVINCPTVRDIKAMCAWEKRNRSNELENHWKTVKERIDYIGPLPRHIFGDRMYIDRCNEVKDALDCINEFNISEYKNILRGNGQWKDKNPCHKLVKIYREVVNGDDVQRNKSITFDLGIQIIARVIKFIKSPILNALFTDNGMMIAEKFEEYGINAFRDRNFVSALSEVLKIIQPPGDRVGRKSVLKRRDLITCPSGVPLSFPTSINDVSRRIEYNKLYYPSISNFPVVDAFYFVKSAEGSVTMIGIQTTIARNHDTTAIAVSQFNKYLETCFSDWADISEKVSWEIIYMQPYETDERRQIRTWQECTLNESQRDPIDKQEVIVKFWKEKVNQYQVNMSQSMIIWLIDALEAICKQGNISTIEELIRIRRYELQQEVNFN